MIRFPNPGSDMGAFIRTFQALFAALRQQPSFTLDDMSRALVNSNLATSSGHIGQQALQRSTRADRSLDPLFNQSKMYSELFRILGWIHPLPSDKQRFAFTYLGAHIGLAKNEPTQLVKECLLGIAYPNPLVDMKGSNSVRPIALILTAAAALDGRIGRNEIILGPMDILDDRDRAQVQAMIHSLRAFRDDPGALNRALEARAGELHIQVNTLHNYTRFPLGILRWAGWTRVKRDSGVFDVLTDGGAKEADRLRSAHDVRSRDLGSFPTLEVESFLRVAVYRMLERAGYSLAALPQTLGAIEQSCGSALSTLGVTDTRRILFSPFQEHDPRQTDQLFPPTSGSGTRVGAPLVTQTNATPGRPTHDSSGHVDLRQVPLMESPTRVESPVIERILQLHRVDRLGLDEIGATVVAEFQGASKDSFYPAVAALFNYIGYRCSLSRVGVNYQRMDALIQLSTDSIPVEIKSPAEQVFISVKGVRQALENKLVLMSRRYSPTRATTTSLVVGYEFPADRSEVLSLVDDIYNAYGVSVGIIDFRSLVRLAAIRLVHDQVPKDEDFFTLRGQIEIHGP